MSEPIRVRHFDGAHWTEHQVDPETRIVALPAQLALLFGGSTPTHTNAMTATRLGSHPDVPPVFYVEGKALDRVLPESCWILVERVGLYQLRKHEAEWVERTRAREARVLSRREATGRTLEQDVAELRREVRELRGLIQRPRHYARLREPY